MTSPFISLSLPRRGTEGKVISLIKEREIGKGYTPYSEEELRERLI